MPCVFSRPGMEKYLVLPFEMVHCGQKKKTKTGRCEQLCCLCVVCLHRCVYRTLRVEWSAVCVSLCVLLFRNTAFYRHIVENCWGRNHHHHFLLQYNPER